MTELQAFQHSLQVRSELVTLLIFNTSDFLKAVVTDTINLPESSLLNLSTLKQGSFITVNESCSVTGCVNASGNVQG